MTTFGNIPIIILAGGLGTRISEETSNKPKPMVLVGEKPLLWHLLNIFAVQGFSEFIIATGYKSEIIEDWVKNLHSSWKIKTLNTGENTQTGGRIKQCMQIVPNKRVLVTYGDGLANVNINELLKFHTHYGKLATVTAVRPPARFGVLEAKNGLVTRFGEKNQADAGWINGGFFVLEPTVSKYIMSDIEPFETGAMPRLVKELNLTAFHHEGFWQPMDTLREKMDLTILAERPTPPWLEIRSEE
jgi:glucose-1-phosphate cytidylyltransferase